MTTLPTDRGVYLVCRPADAQRHEVAALNEWLFELLATGGDPGVALADEPGTEAEASGPPPCEAARQPA